MGKTSIEWTDASWNPIVGCTEVSPGCANCYAARLAATRLRNTPQYKGLATIVKGSKVFRTMETTVRWTGEVRFLPERLDEPLHWRKPRRIFVCDMGDLFHESVHGDWIDQVLRVISDCPQHTFQILTKRAQRMQEFLRHYPLMHHVWLGVSVENQHFANERIPLLIDTPAAVHWISAEPLLGPVSLHLANYSVTRWLDWIVCGGESGQNARPMHPEWARSLREQCIAAGVPFFFKQWGEWLPADQGNKDLEPSADRKGEFDKLGKKAAGRLLDGREWNEFPKGTP